MSEVKSIQRPRLRQCCRLVGTVCVCWILGYLSLMRMGFADEAVLIPVASILLFWPMVVERAVAFLAITVVTFLLAGVILPSYVIFRKDSYPRNVEILTHIGISWYMFWNFLLLSCALV